MRKCVLGVPAGVAAMVWLIAPGAVEARAAQAVDEIGWEAYEAELEGRVIEGARLGRLRVPENRADPTGRMIEIAFVLLPGRAADGVPTVYLDGGPGGGGVGVMGNPGWGRLLDGLRDVGDVILLSQRGTGMSEPALLCRPAGEITGELFASREAMFEQLEPTFEACVDHWRERVDIAAFNTRESADDVESLRRALGAEKVNLLGFSYGTHLALAVIRRHGESVGRAVLAGVEGPNHTYKLPSVLDTQLRNLSYLVSRDETAGDDFPDLYAALDTILAELDRSPRIVEMDDGTRVTLGGDGLRYLLRRDIGDTNDLPALPALVQDVRSEPAPLLTRLVARRFRGLTRGMHLMSVAMDCASASTAARLRRIRGEWSATLLGDMSETLYPDACDRLPAEVRLDDAFRSPIRSRVPTLFVSGTLDANTPPHQAMRVGWGFPNSAHVIVENAGHESTLDQPDVQDAIFRFLETGEPRSVFIHRPPLDFLDRSEALARMRKP